MSRDLKNYLMFEFFVSSLTPMLSTLEQANAYTDAEVSGAIAECKQYTDDAASVLDTKINETTADILQDANTYTDTEIADILATMDNVIKIDSTITSSELNLLLADTNKKVKNIYFTAGTYTLGDIRLKANTHILLDKDAIINVIDKHLFFNFELEDTEVLAYDGQGNITVEGGTINGHIASFIHGENITIRNIKANDCYNDHYIELSACKDVLIKDNTFSGMIAQTVERNYVEYVQIDNCTHTNFPHLGVETSATFDLTSNLNIKIYDNEFKKSLTTNYDNVYACIGTHSSVPNYHQNIEIKGNRFYNASHAAIAIRGWRYALIQNNYFDTCESALQIMYGSSDITFVDNFVQKSNSAIYTYNSNTSTFYFLKIARNKFDECVHRLVCEVDESVTPIIVNGGQIWDTDNRIEDSGTDIIRYKRDVFSFNNSYKRVNIQNLGYVHLLDNVVDATIKDNRYASVYTGGLTYFNIAKVAGDCANIVVDNNTADTTLLHNAVDNQGDAIYTDGKTISISDVSLDTMTDNGFYYGMNCTNTPAEVNTSRFTLQISGKSGYITQTLIMTYDNTIYTRTYHDAWSEWQQLARANDINKVNVLDGQDLNTITQTGEYYGINCTNTPGDVGTARFTLKVINNDGWISQELYYIYGNKLYGRTNYEGWKNWVDYGNTVQGETYYTETHASGANVGSGTWIAGGTKFNTDFKTRAKSAIIIGSDTANAGNTIADIVAIGDGVMAGGKIGEHNIGVGLFALHNLNIGAKSSTSAGDRNIAIGSLSYPALTEGRGNTGVGRDTAQCCVSGDYNIALGYRAMGGGAPIGIDGKVACWWSGTFSSNIAIGLDAAHDLVTSSNNLMMGNNSGFPVKNGSWNNIIGYNAGATLEKTRSYNGKKLIINDPYENTTYSTNGTDLITVNHVGNKAEQGNYVIIEFTSGVINAITTSRQLLYVVERTNNYFVLQSPVVVGTGSGNAQIREYEIDTVETLPTASSSNIIGVAACQLAETVKNSNIIGMRAAAATECSNSNVMGFGAFYGNTDVGNCENSDVIGKDACYNVNTCKYSQIIGYQSAYNTIVKLEEALIQGYQAARNCPNVFKSNVFGSNAAIGVTSKIELSVINGAYAASESETITKAVITGHNAAKRLTMCNESNIIGEGSCVNTGAVNLSNIIGQGILLNSSGYVVEDSDIIGARACYNSENLKFTVGVGRGSLTNTRAAENTTSVGASNQHVFDKLTNCSFFGYAAGQNTAEEILELENCTCVGFATGVTGNNQIQLGNGNTTTYVYGTVQNRSDVRDKADIRDTVLGLDFIKRLKPVDYKWDLRESYIDIDEDGNQVKNPIDGSRKRNRYHHGFIAQDVKKIIEGTGLDFGGYQDHSVNGGSDVKSLGYDEFIAPMVKAIQELSEKLETLENKIKEMEQLK